MEFLLTLRLVQWIPNWYGNLLVFLKDCFRIGNKCWTAHSFGSVGSEEEDHLLELRRLMWHNSINVSKLIGREIRWVGVFDDGDAQQPANCYSRNPQDGNTDESDGSEDAPMRPFLILSSSQLSHPSWIIGSVVYQIHERCEENRQHGNWTDVLPA